MDQPLIVQAEYSFKGGNNDELCFKKGDLITVTQREEGGWWEGTLNDKTGWFPSNYVNEYKAPLPITESIRPPEEIQEYRSVVLKDLLDSERAHVAEIQGLLENFLEPLQQTQILTADEYAQLMCNFVEIVKIHEELLSQMEECNDRVGKLFLTKAPIMKQAHQAYCAAHPKAIVILDKHKDELEKYMERQGAASPGLLVLTTGLSKPFRRLDKYSAMLQELERHMENSHPDRGDTQRSVSVYKDIAATCSATRRQKELELQVLTGPVRGWQGQELSSLGDIIHMGSVAVGPDHRDRYFVLFPHTLLILSVSQRMSAFIYEGKLPLTGIIVNRLDDSDIYKNAFEINSPLIERIVAVCQGPNEANKWVELLTSVKHSMPVGIKRQLSNLSNASIGGGGHVHQPPTHNQQTSQNLDTRGYCTRFSLCAYYNSPSLILHNVTLPPTNYPPAAPYAGLSEHFANLVKAGKLQGTLVKMLLYPQSRQSIDLKLIPIRQKKCHKATVKLIKKNCNYVMDTFSIIQRLDLERQNAFEIPTDSESEDEVEDSDVGDCGGECVSNPFEFIQFYTDKHDSVGSTGTFIDHGSGANSPHRMRHTSSINLIRFDSDNVDDDKRLSGMHKESLIIGSKTMHAIARKSSEQSAIIHTSTARLDLSGNITANIHDPKTHLRPPLKQQQTSETSEMSSVYNGRLGGAYVACENLADMCDETQIKTDRPNVVPAERHSMPNIFVGNRFNRSSKTSVYVPSWKDRNEVQNESVDGIERNTQSSNLVIHSSSVDLPPTGCHDIPDKLQAELLYNFKDSNDIIAPPSLYKESSRQPREESADPKRRSNSLRRFIHFQCIPMNLNNERESSHQICSDLKITNETNYIPDNRYHARNRHRNGNSSATDLSKCKCCENSQCPSPRSSDSGMAGSCTIASPDPPQTELNYYDIEGSSQLISTPLIEDSDSTDMVRFDVCGTFREKFLTSEVVQESSDITNVERSSNPLNADVDVQLKASSIVLNTTNPIVDTSKINLCSNMIFTPNLEKEDAPETSGLFRSGMYAHWWKKEPLPTALVGSIKDACKEKLLPTQQASEDSRCSLCSSCYCAVGAGGFGEEAIYCSICQDCTSFKDSSRAMDSTYQNSSTFPYTPRTSIECPLCSGSYIARHDSLGSIAEDVPAAVLEGKQTIEHASLFLKMSPPANLSLLSQRMNNQQQSTGTTNCAATTTAAAPPAMSLPSQHKRSLSFNHHLSYNQYTHSQHPPPAHQPHHPQQQQSLPNHPAPLPSHKSNLVQTSSSISKTPNQTHLPLNMATNVRSVNTKANWSITNLRPAPPLRPSLFNANATSNTTGCGGGGGSSSNALSSYFNSRKNQPTFEEDALVLRVFEAYSAAYQNNIRNTIHSVLQPWTPCLPIRGGKLKTSKPFSTSNPQLPFLCSAGVPFPGSSGASNQQNSTNSLNSSYIWREASPNNFNLYSSSISSLNAAGYRYSLSGSAGTGPSGNANTSLGVLDYRALSEERATRKSLNRLKSGFGSGYDNIFMTPLLPRKNKTSPKIIKSNYQGQKRPPNIRQYSEEQPASTAHPGLYDRRLNRSFESGSSNRYAGYGGGYMLGYGLKSTAIRRSTPHLTGDEGLDDSDDVDGRHSIQKACTTALLKGNTNGSATPAGDAAVYGVGNGDSDSQRHSGNWCCGLENEDMTPTLRQLWTAIHQLQQDMTQIKQIINDEVALRVSLQQLLMQHLETGSATSNTSKC
uniref:Rho guanine nucleotide exchange factor 7 n=1 Tax=Glossina pallidipes TaxID=7398 RepID=A0A1A9ZI02_GLOPL